MGDAGGVGVLRLRSSLARDAWLRMTEFWWCEERARLAREAGSSLRSEVRLEKQKQEQNRTSNNKGNRSVVTPFGLHSGLRQSGVLLVATVRPKAEALGYLEARASARASAEADSPRE